MHRTLRSCAVFVITLVLASSALGADAKRPNVLLILTDDQRWDCLGLTEKTPLKTPHLDRLAKEGVYFKNAFCTTSLCSPSRASILSGLYAHQHGVVDNFTEYPADLASFPRQLQKAGYTTGYIGKYHMGENNDEPRPGFDYFVTHKGQGKYFDTEFNVNGAKREVMKGYYTHVVTQLAVDWISDQQEQERPYCLILGHKAPHSFYYPEPKYEHAFDDVQVEYPDTAFKLDAKPDWIKQRLSTWHGIYGPLFDYRKKFPDARPEAVEDFARMTRAYWGTILSIDDSVGRLYNHLAKSHDLDNTVIIFMGDNGLLNGEHGMVDKRTAHEPSIRIPLIMRAPQLTPSNKPRVVDAMALTVDIAPTVCELTGAAPLREIHGRSLVKLAQGDATGWRTSMLYSYNYEKQFPYTPNVRAVRTDHWKYIHYPHGDGSPDKHKAELYHLDEDPEERHNLIDNPQHTEQLADLKQELARLLKETGAAPDKMPLDQGIQQALPDAKIR